MSMTNYLEQKLLDHTFGGSAFSQPAACYIKLHLGDPGEDATANPALNTTRIVVTFAAAVNPAGTKTSNVQAQWVAVPNTETYSYISLWDASSAGNPLLTGALTSPVSVTAGGTFTIASGQLVATFD
jgi:hypothetical protein